MKNTFETLRDYFQNTNFHYKLLNGPKPYRYSSSSFFRLFANAWRKAKTVSASSTDSFQNPNVFFTCFHFPFLNPIYMIVFEIDDPIYMCVRVRACARVQVCMYLREFSQNCLNNTQIVRITFLLIHGNFVWFFFLPHRYHPMPQFTL